MEHDPLPPLPNDPDQPVKSKLKSEPNPNSNPSELPEGMQPLQTLQPVKARDYPSVSDKASEDESQLPEIVLQPANVRWVRATAHYDLSKALSTFRDTSLQRIESFLLNANLDADQATNFIEQIDSIDGDTTKSRVSSFYQQLGNLYVSVSKNGSGYFMSAFISIDSALAFAEDFCEAHLDQMAVSLVAASMANVDTSECSSQEIEQIGSGLLFLHTRLKEAPELSAEVIALLKVVATLFQDDRWHDARPFRSKVRKLIQRQPAEVVMPSLQSASDAFQANRMRVQNFFREAKLNENDSRVLAKALATADTDGRLLVNFGLDLRQLRTASEGGCVYFSLAELRLDEVLMPATVFSRIGHDIAAASLVACALNWPHLDLRSKRFEAALDLIAAALNNLAIADPTFELPLPLRKSIADAYRKGAKAGYSQHPLRSRFEMY